MASKISLLTSGVPAGSARQQSFPLVNIAFGARGVSHSWLVLLVAALTTALPSAVAGEPRQLAAPPYADSLAGGGWRPPSAGVTMKLQDNNPFREEDADGEVYRTGCACSKYDFWGD